MAETKRKFFITEKLPPEPTGSIGDMDDLMARTIVENLSLGVNPISGQALDDNDVCANETVQEALRIVLEHCSLESYTTKAHERSPEKRKEKKEILSEQARLLREQAENEEKRKLAQLCREGKSVLEMAREMRCSTGEICEKLKRLR